VWLAVLTSWWLALVAMIIATVAVVSLIADAIT